MVYSCSIAYHAAYGYGADGGAYGASSAGVYGGAEYDVDYTYVVDRLDGTRGAPPADPGAKPTLSLIHI